ncbi:unnamed protein product [Cunninghamella echinulata]
MLRHIQKARLFSTTSVSKQLFVVVAKDHPGQEGVQRRLSVRAEHLEGANKAYDQGKIKLGGAMLDSHDGGNMIGSIMIVEAENIDKAREFIKGDVYVSKDVWKSWEIHPYRGALGIK